MVDMESGQLPVEPDQLTVETDQLPEQRHVPLEPRIHVVETGVTSPKQDAQPEPEPLPTPELIQEPIIPSVPAAQPNPDPIPMTDPTPTLDPEILAALGDSTDEKPEFGAKIHENLANLWMPILKKGMAKDNKENIIKEYKVPENCKLLQSPKLNPEISAAISDVYRNRDKKLATFQQQLGQGVTAINRAMDILIQSDDKISAMKHLSDSCRILSDLHYLSTADRIKRPVWKKHSLTSFRTPSEMTACLVVRCPKKLKLLRL